MASGLARSSDGYHYHDDVKERGLLSEGVVIPATNLSKPGGNNNAHAYDAIIIGAGYTGITAALNLVQNGAKVLLLEARDRIGGRSWTAELNGDKWEMGGAYVHWFQPFLWAAIVKYDMQNDLIPSVVNDFAGSERNEFVYNGKSYSYTTSEMTAMADKVFWKFFDVDGKGGRDVVPIPPSRMDSFMTDKALVEKWDSVSIGERLKDLLESGELNEEEVGFGKAFLAVNHGGFEDTSTVFGNMSWYMGGGGTYSRAMESSGGFKLKAGSSHLQRSMFDEAVRSGKLDYSLSTPVDMIKCEGGTVQVVTGKSKFVGSRAICTLPLNVLKDMKFSPPVSDLRRKGFEVGHGNFCEKVLIESSHVEDRVALGFRYDDAKPAGLMIAMADKYLQGGKSAGLACFAANTRHEAHTPYSQDHDGFLDELEQLLPGSRKHWVRSVFHEYGPDPYSQGAWCNTGPDWHKKYYAELKKPHHQIIFANSDLASGWKGYIEGAMEQGTKAAMQIVKDLQLHSRAV